MFVFATTNKGTSKGTMAAKKRKNNADAEGTIIPGAEPGDFLHPGVPDGWELQFYLAMALLLAVLAATFFFLGHVPWVKTAAVAFGVLTVGLVFSVQWFLSALETAEREKGKEEKKKEG